MLFRSHVKYIQSLSQKKLREEEQVFVAEGTKLVMELLKAGNVQLQQLYAVAGWLETNKNVIHEFPGATINEINDVDLTRISNLTTPAQVIGVFNFPIFQSPIQLEDQVSLMLDSIQDPGNIGAILRCADWFGIKQMICSHECADIFNPKVIQSSMGSISRVQVVYEDLKKFADEHSSIPFYAATLNGTNLYELSPVTEGVLVIGNESRGIDETLLKNCRFTVTIPRKGKAESLNAAVATGIILSHLYG